MQGDGTTPDDGRKEVYKDGPDEDGQQFNNTGYTETQKPENSIVFRSYSDPDGTDQFTKLRVKFINKVKTGSLSITKQVPPDEQATLGDKNVHLYRAVLEHRRYAPGRQHGSNRNS